MAFEGYSEKPLYESMIATSTGLAKTLPSRSSKAVDISRFKNIPAMVNNSGMNYSQSTPASLKNLGTETLHFLEPSRYEPAHLGLDIANVTGKKIPAFQGGTVTSVQTPAQSGGFGNSVIVTDNKGNKWRYSHLNRSYVKANEQIGTGSIIGEIGRSGNVYSESGGDPSHLDIRIQNIWGKYVDPKSMIY